MTTSGHSRAPEMPPNYPHSTTLKFYVQFTASADQRAAVIIPSQLDTLR